MAEVSVYKKRALRKAPKARFSVRFYLFIKARIYAADTSISRVPKPYTVTPPETYSART